MQCFKELFEGKSNGLVSVVHTGAAFLSTDFVSADLIQRIEIQTKYALCLCLSVSWG